MKLFGGGRPDHPMADRKDARRILDALPAQDLEALEELAQWHESVGAADAFKPDERAQLFAMIDEAAQPRLSKLSAEYFRAGRVQQNLLWMRIHEYWRQAGQAHARAAGAKALAELIVGALRAFGQQLKWQQLRYGPIDSAVWGLANAIYALAEARGVAAAKPEFLKAALLGASAMDSRPAAEIELAERVIDALSAQLVIETSACADLPFWTDLGRAMAPARSKQPPPPAPGVRFIGPGAALAALQAKINEPQESEALLGVMRHLAAHWASTPPERRHKRHSMTSRLKIAYGFDGVVEALGGETNSLDFGTEPTSWVAENVSAGGFGALAPQPKGDWLKIGALVAAWPEGASGWMVGTVRRVNKISPQEIRVGVETLSRTPGVSRFALPGAGEAQGVLLPAAPGETAIALRAGLYAQHENLEAIVGGRSHVYMPQGLAERGEDYEIVRFKEMIREP